MLSSLGLGGLSSFSNDLSLGFGTVLEELASYWITISGPTDKDRKHLSGDHAQHTALRGSQTRSSSLFPVSQGLWRMILYDVTALACMMRINFKGTSVLGATLNSLYRM